MGEESSEAILARIDERQKAMAAALDDVRSLLTAQNGRLRSLESWRSMLAGAVAIISVVVTFALSVAANHF